MPTNIIMPKFGFTQDESEIVEWLVAEGDYVDEGDPIAEVTTDKVNMEVEAPVSGYLSGIRYEVGTTVRVTEVIAVMVSKKGEVRSWEREEAGSREQGAGSREQQEGHGVERVLGDKVRATPAARRAARVLGVALADVAGRGPRGRVQVADVELAARAVQVLPVTQQDVVTEQPIIGTNGKNGRKPPSTPSKMQPLSKMRLTIGSSLQRSWQEAPHIFFEATVDVTDLLALLQRVNQQRPNLPEVTLTAGLTRVVAWALTRHPRINCHLMGREIVQFESAEIGMAVAIEDGLLVPVIRSAESKTITQLSDDIRAVAGRARAGKLRADDMGGATFTISNLGMMGIDKFTAIINPPEVGILAVGATKRVFVPDSADNPTVRSVLSLTLSVDHRAVDGADAARFMQTLKQGVEQIEWLLI